ncbi:unnamed protein product [Gordionus sp. m RMFG-2023]
MITLRYLATGDSYATMAYSYTRALWDVMQPIHIKVPSLEMSEEVAGFDEMWNFPNCIGAIDGKHYLNHDLSRFDRDLNHDLSRFDRDLNHDLSRFDRDLNHDLSRFDRDLNHDLSRFNRDLNHDLSRFNRDLNHDLSRFNRDLNHDLSRFNRDLNHDLSSPGAVTAGQEDVGTPSHHPNKIWQCFVLRFW